MKEEDNSMKEEGYKINWDNLVGVGPNCRSKRVLNTD